MSAPAAHLDLSPAGLPVFALALTIGCYLLGVELWRRTRSPLAHPVLIAIVLIGLALRVLHLSYALYFSAAQGIHLLLGPATVALAIPLVRSLEQMRRRLGPMLAALLGGSLVGMLSGYGLVRLLGGNQLIALSMLPKSVTTPIAIGIAETIGGSAPLSAVLAIAGGILVAVCMDAVLGSMGINGRAARGLAAGAAGSGIGAARVIPEHALSAAFAGVAIGANGWITAVLAPVLVPLLKHW